MRLLNKIKNEFLNSNNLNKIIYINVLIFLLINIISVISTLYVFEIQPYIDKLTLSSETSKIITQPWSLFTFMFIHDNFLHLIFNMLWLHFGGKLFLDYLNEKQLIYTYILGGIFGGILFVIAFNYFPKLINNFLGLPLWGSSASVLAVFFGISTKVPNYQIKFPFLGHIKLKYISLFLFIISFSLLEGTNPGGNFAHIGGAFFGYIYIKQIQNKRKSLFSDFISIFRNPKSKKTKSKKEINEVDVVLEKISKSGYSSLNEQEKDLLFKSSKK
tara:strand:- start:164 stop:982 length:819 start_codon:yes stop_codon:yes gene_type:complete